MIIQDVVNRSLEVGGNVEERSNDGWTLRSPHKESEKDHLDVINWLVDKAEDSQGETKTLKSGVEMSN